MSYRFFSTTPEGLRREGERRARLRQLAAAVEARLPPEGRPPGWEPAPVAMGFTEAQRGVSGIPPVPAAAVIALTRLAFGPRPGDVAAFDALGGTDAARLEGWVDEQLDPEGIDDSAAESRLAQSGFTTLDKDLTRLWQEHMLSEDWEVHMRPFFETELATFIRAIHSRRQLFEVMVDFWHNHFNVFAYDFLVGSVWVHTDRDAIRPHALGNFRALMGAVARTPAMLFYLDNFRNSLEDANENYARELLELHTLGSEHYFGNIDPGDVPRDGEDRPLGYVEADVIAAARCLTGWTFDWDWYSWQTNTGAFVYRDAWHDKDAKSVLGQELPAGRGMEDGEDLFDLLASHPATGRHVATKLCRRLIGDTPPASVVDEAAAVFTAGVDDADQIARVVRTVVLSPEFRSTWAEKVKRPLEIAMSAFRGAQGDIPFRVGEDVTNHFLWVYYQTGQPLFSWHAPDGYPDARAAWNSTSPRVLSWRLANMLIQVSDESFAFHFDVLGQTPSEVRSAEEIVGFWGERILGRPLADPEREELVKFMAQGRDPVLPLPLDTDQDTRDRLRALVALIFQTPSFLWR